MDVLISTVNAADIGWKADTCKLQKTHHMYDCNGDAELLQIDSDVQTLDGEGDKKKTFGQGADFGTVHAQALQY